MAALTNIPKMKMTSYLSVSGAHR